LRPPYGRLFEFKRSKLRFLDSIKNVRFMLKMSSYAGCPRPSSAISAPFTLKMCVAAENSKIITKTPILRAQDHSRSSTLTPIKSLSLLLVVMSSTSVSICNLFHATRNNCGKNNHFLGVDVFDARLRRPP